MTLPAAKRTSSSGTTGVRLLRAAVILGLAVFAGLLCDFFRHDRTFFARAADAEFTTLPSAP